MPVLIIGTVLWRHGEDHTAPSVDVPSRGAPPSASSGASLHSSSRHA